MGWKTSILIIENQNDFKDDKAILKALGKDNFKFKEELTLGYNMLENDESICIAYYQGNIIIFDDYQITSESIESVNGLKLTKTEQNLVGLFPNSEIVMTACHSVVNYHGYCLIENGKKVRLKRISAEDELREFGKRTKEEDDIYKNSYQKDGNNYWKDKDYPNDDDYTEDQLMEDFTFEIAKRRLGFRLDTADADELMATVVFKKYAYLDKKKRLIKK